MKDSETEEANGPRPSAVWVDDNGGGTIGCPAESCQDGRWSADRRFVSVSFFRLLCAPSKSDSLNVALSIVFYFNDIGSSHVLCFVSIVFRTTGVRVGLTSCLVLVGIEADTYRHTWLQAVGSCRVLFSITWYGGLRCTA